MSRWMSKRIRETTKTTHIALPALVVYAYMNSSLGVSHGDVGLVLKVIRCLLTGSNQRVTEGHDCFNYVAQFKDAGCIGL